MPDHTIGTREQWQAARAELVKLEAEQAELERKVIERRRQLPWVPVEKEYRFGTENGKKTLGELFDGRSQLLAYSIMFGPDYGVGACPGCSNVGDELDATRVHLSHRDVTLICFSRAPIDRLIAYRERMGWRFPWVSMHATEFPFDFGLALTPEQAQEIPEVREIIENPPDWLEDWGAAGREPSSRTACGRTRVSSRSRARTGPSITPTRCRRPIRSSRRITPRCSNERRRLRPTSSAPGARTNTQTDGGAPLPVRTNATPTQSAGSASRAKAMVKADWGRYEPVASGAPPNPSSLPSGSR